MVRNRPYLVHLTALLQLLASDAKEIYENIVQVIKINRKLISSQIDSGRNGVILEICSKDFEPVFGMCNFSFSLEQWQLLL